MRQSINDFAASFLAKTNAEKAELTRQMNALQIQNSQLIAEREKWLTREVALSAIAERLKQTSQAESRKNAVLQSEVQKLTSQLMHLQSMHREA